MIASNFRIPASDVAGGVAEDGLGKWTRRTTSDQGSVYGSYRLIQAPTRLEHTLIDHMCAGIFAHGVALSRAFVTNYYVSLKTNPFVVLTGGDSKAHTALVQGVAEALVGSESSQYVHIAGGASWPYGTGEDGYYRSLLERFESLRFLELLHDAALPSNSSKTYFVCLDGLHPNEINHFFGQILLLTADGEKRLALPGLPEGQEPVVPTNVYITANIHVPIGDNRLNQRVLCHAGILDLPMQVAAGPSSDCERMRPVPVGYQRIMLQAAIHDVDAARCKLGAILGDAATSQLRPSLALTRILWRAGIVLGSRTLRQVTRYVANSFDKHGRGLFDQENAQRNAQNALDVHTIQRVMWQLRDDDGASIRQELLAYRDDLLAV